ncbi:hypothetical protein B0J17DRAFT_706873 [Rhizoctonia solani]|nr:hypothetical protein B0J17DRAFT_706873 [Rhizoctonia solani]
MNVRITLLQFLRFTTVISGVFMTWKTLCMVTNCESPVVVVLSGSMKPAFARGDILFLHNPHTPFKIGDAIVYKVPGDTVPIVHRIIETHVQNTSIPTSQLILTKGDNNLEDDILLYKGLSWIEKRHIIGKIRGFLPCVGYISIALNENQTFRTLLFVGLGLWGLVQG